MSEKTENKRKEAEDGPFKFIKEQWWEQQRQNVIRPQS